MKIIKENKKSLIVLSVIILLALVALIFQKSYAFPGASGTSGDCKWTIDTAGKMIIEPSSGSSCTLKNNSGYYDQSPWYSNSTYITSVEVKEGVKANTNSIYLFADISYAKTIDVTNLDTSNVTYMEGMFNGCSSLTSLDVTNFNTSNVTDMRGMFANCYNLASLDLSNFDTRKVTTMRSMFNRCSRLTSIDVTNFNTSNVTDMGAMFYECNWLASLDLRSFNTNNVTEVAHMFYNIGGGMRQGTKLILNNTFNETYATNVNYNFPYSYYTKEVNGSLDNRLYTLSEMKNETARSSTPTTWVPAYQVNYDKGSGDSVSGTTPQIYRIGSKINTNGLLGVKQGSEFTKWNNSTDGTGDLTINKDATSTNSYGDKYASVDTNNVLTLYAQYEELEDPVVMKDKDNNELDKNGEGLYIVPNNKYSYTVRYITDSNGNISKDSEEVRYEEKPLGFLDTPKSGYRFLMMKCDKGVTLDNGKTILPLKPISQDELKKIKVKENLVCNVYHKLSTEKTMQCE